MPLKVLEEKLALLHAHDILTYPGGTLLEAAIVQEHCRVFMKRAKELGFGAVEVSEGTIELPGERRRRAIDCAREAGLIAITEVGRKDPKRQPTAAELAEQALKDLSSGASWVVIEARECGQGIGIYDREGEVLTCVLDEIVRSDRGRRCPPDLGGPPPFPAGISDLPVRRQCQPRQHPTTGLFGSGGPALRPSIRDILSRCHSIL